MREIAFVVMVIGGVSTVLFNGNPLLRFDGYYVLSDLLDVPNLGPARNAVRRLPRAAPPAEGASGAVSPVTAKGERAVAVRLCGAVLLLPLVRLRPDRVVGGQYSFWLGMLAGALVLVSMVVKPLPPRANSCAQAPQLARNRTRSLCGRRQRAAAVLVTLFVVPVPFSTVAQGVVWLPEKARVRAETGGFVSEVLAADGQHVKPGEPLLG